jgi:hypothetical protein
MNNYRVPIRKPEGSGHLEDQDLDRGILLKCILERQNGVA